MTRPRAGMTIGGEDVGLTGGDPANLAPSSSQTAH